MTIQLMQKKKRNRYFLHESKIYSQTVVADCISSGCPINWQLSPYYICAKWRCRQLSKSKLSGIIREAGSDVTLA